MSEVLMYCQRGCTERVLYYSGDSDVGRDLFDSNAGLEFS